MASYTYIVPILTVALPLVFFAKETLFPTTASNRVAKRTVWFFAFSWIASIATLAQVSLWGPIDLVLVNLFTPLTHSISVGLWIDRLSALMLVLISTVGFVVLKYSLRYLAGEIRQTYFIRWLSLVLFAVSVFVTSRNLLQMTLFWFLVSAGIHRLLLYFPDRKNAQKAAWRKFVISRLGDLSLCIALGFTVATFGTLEIKSIFEQVRASQFNPLLTVLGWNLNSLDWVAFFFVLGAMTKSAQFPFHIWLPDTMETPTPVSALMHAGVINAGGFLVVRLSPLLGQAPIALHLLFALGAITALFGGLIYWVQTDIKRALAYSTISQMGYMMMQCGLGAFSAAILHIVTHGIYKAHAFLSAASAVGQRRERLHSSLKTSLICAAVALGLIWLSVSVVGISLKDKPGGYFLLVFLFSFAFQSVKSSWAKKNLATGLLGTLFTFVGLLVYWALLSSISLFLSGDAYASAGYPVYDGIEPWLMAGAAALLVALTLLSELAVVYHDRPWAKHFYVTCLNHFYVEYAWRWLANQTLPQRLLPSFETTARSQAVRLKTGSLQKRKTNENTYATFH